MSTVPFQDRIIPVIPAPVSVATLLPAPLIAHFGGDRDPFLVRLLGRPDAECVAECEWRARGAWDCNERESYAAYYAVADIMRGVTRTTMGWGQDWYDYYRGFAPMPSGRGWF